MFNLQGGKVHLEELGENVGDLGKSLDLGVAAEVGHVFDRLQKIMQFQEKSSEIKEWHLHPNHGVDVLAQVEHCVYRLLAEVGEVGEEPE